MKKIILLSALLACVLTGCKKKKDDPSPSNNTDANNNAPAVSITSPENNSSSYASTITISVNASDTDGSVAKVEFYDGTTKLGEDLSAPFSLEVDLVVGGHTLTAKAYDNKNASTISSVANYSVLQVIIPTPGPMVPAVVK